ncbi:MAG: hypothetical protein ACJAVI_002243 [Candidatus Azotimanducaceae bacterium]|jgi:hypothetical protein
MPIYREISTDASVEIQRDNGAVLAYDRISSHQLVANY